MRAYNSRKIKYKKCKIIHSFEDLNNLTSCYGFRIKAGEYATPSMFDYFTPSFYDMIAVYHKETNIIGFVPEDLYLYTDMLKSLGFNFKLAEDYKYIK